MAKQLSFTKLENELLHDYRQRLNSAESTEDVKKFFVYTARELFENVFAGEVGINYEDISLMPDTKPYYSMEKRLSTLETFGAIWDNSDLSRVIARFAETAVNRCRHLDKHPEKTALKIRN